MKARIHGRQVSEFDIMGHHTFGRGAGYAQEMPGDQLENRQYLIDFCRYNNYIITSTYFSKPPQKQCTFKFSETEGFAAPWTLDRFAQLDHILRPKRWKNAIVDTESRPDIVFDTDHAVLTCFNHKHTNQTWKERLLETTKDCEIQKPKRAGKDEIQR
jgi:hypothetical protein